MMLCIGIILTFGKALKGLIKSKSQFLTLFGTGLKIYVKWRGEGDVCHTQNHCEKTNFFFAFQIGHIEIGKVTKFGVIWRPF